MPHCRSAVDIRNESWPISRVLSRTIIHLQCMSPYIFSDLPEPWPRAAACGFLFGLAPGGVYTATLCCHRRGALLPHHFTLTESFNSAVYFLLHFPWISIPQALPGTLPCGARTFLPPHDGRRLSGQLSQRRIM